MRPIRPCSSVLKLSACALGVLLGGAVGVGPARGAETESEPASKPRTEVRQSYIDEMIKAAWDEAGVKPSRPATDEEYMRRLYLDVLGRIPNIQEAAGFLGSKEKGKREKLVEYLLNHPDYARNFGTQWTVLLVGRKRQERQVDREALSAWMRRQFLENRPWDRVVFDLVTAKGSNKENGAVNFPLAHMEFGAVPLTSVTTRLFVGQQIQCTQCHDHPSNDWKQADFWGINAFYKGMRAETIMKADATGAEVEDHTELADEPTDSFAQYDRRNGLVGIAFPKYLDGRKISQGGDVDRRSELGKFLADPKNKDLARAFVNRIWGHFMGRGIVHPVDDFGAHNPPSHPELLDKMAEDFQKAAYDVKSLVRWIANSQTYQLSSVMTKQNEKDETLFSHMALKPMTPEQLFDSLLTATSAHKAGGDSNATGKRDQWLRQFIFAFANDEGEEGSSFQGTIPQALMMMNGPLMKDATEGKPGSFLEGLRVEAMRKPSPPTFMANELYLAALSRFPSKAEMKGVSGFVEGYPDTLGVLQDLFWALLNSNEFVLNR